MFGNKQKKGKEKEKRFEYILTENLSSALTSFKIIRDKETGACYFFHQFGYAAGLTPLLDKDGKPVVKI
jgi:hypothetical protein